MKEEYMKDIRMFKIQSLIIALKNYKEVFYIIFIVLFITVILIYKLAPENTMNNILNNFLNALIDLSITVFIGGILLTVVSSLYNTQQEYNEIRKDLIDKLLNSYNKVKKIRRVQEYNKNDKFNVQEPQLNNLIDVQLEFENYMNQIDFYSNIFREEKAEMLFDLAHQMEHYLNELSKAFANLKKLDPSYFNVKDTQKINNFLDKKRFNEDFSLLFHESLGLIREDFLSHTQKSMNNEDSCRIRKILLRAKYNDSYSISK